MNFGPGLQARYSNHLNPNPIEFAGLGGAKILGETAPPGTANSVGNRYPAANRLLG